MGVSRSGKRALVCLAMIFAGNSCGPQIPTPPDEIRNTAAVMDRMADIEAEYGTMAISSPQLVRPGDEIRFSISQGSQEFFDQAKTSRQGHVDEFQQIASSFGAGLTVSVNPLAAAQDAAQMTQYAAAVAQNRSAANAVDQKRQIANTAANTQYNAAVQAAQKESEPQRSMDIAKAQLALSNSLQGQSPTTLPSFPQATTQPATMPSLVQSPTDQTDFFANKGSFTNFQSLTTQPSDTIPNRTALITAAGDNAVKAIFTILGNPKLGETFRNKRVLYGVSTVSVNPGWRTKKGYAADVASECEYDLVPARREIVEHFVKGGALQAYADLRAQIAIDNNISITGARVKPLQLPVIPSRYTKGTEDEETTKTPVVAVVSPMTETQNLDLESSFRRQREIALNLGLQLQLAGANAQAQAFFKYANSLQQDVGTLTSDVVVNSYSTGNLFGFQVGPRLKAVEEIKKKEYSGPAEILDRQSFPALIIFGFDDRDLAPVIVNESGVYRVYERRVKMVSANSWVATEPGTASKTFTESERLALSYQINQLSDIAEKNKSIPGTTGLMKIRIKALKSHSFGSFAIFSLPTEIISPPVHPQVTDIQPASLEQAQGEAWPITRNVLLAGNDLEGVDLSSIQPVVGKATVSSAALAGNAIKLTVSITAADEPLIFKLSNTFGDASFTSQIPVKKAATVKMPVVQFISPNAIALAVDASGNVAPAKQIPVILTGNDLDAIDTAKISATSNSATVSKAAMSGNALVLTVDVTAPGAIAFILPIKTTANSVISPPIDVAIERIAIDQSVKAGDPKNSRDMHIAFPADTPPGLLKSAIAPPKKHY